MIVLIHPHKGTHTENDAQNIIFCTERNVVLKVFITKEIRFSRRNDDYSSLMEVRAVLKRKRRGKPRGAKELINRCRKENNSNI